MKIQKHNFYNDYDLKAEGENNSHIVDKLIRLAAKITEYYANDIVYDINVYKQYVKARQPYDFILCFREMGINSYSTKSVMEPSFESVLVSETIQSWRLCYDPEQNITTLTRVDL